MKRIILIVILIKIFLFLYYLSSRTKEDKESREMPDEEINYGQLSNKLINISKLENCKSNYPFAEWRLNAIKHGMKQYTEENCEAIELLFDELIADLKMLPADATAEDKVLLFKYAVLATNTIHHRIHDLIETGEREDLCELMDQITIAAGLEPTEFADGEGIASEWREW